MPSNKQCQDCKHYRGKTPEVSQPWCARYPQVPVAGLSTNELSQQMVSLIRPCPHFPMMRGMGVCGEFEQKIDLA